MGSTFSTLGGALTGLYAAQRLVEVAGQNIDNMNTPGYTRQRIEQRAIGLASTPSIFAGSVIQGGGVEMEPIRRCGDFFLESKLRLETGRAAQTSEIKQSWDNIETAMDEMGNMSINKTMGEFYKAWGDVNNASDNSGARATVLGRAQALTDQLKTGYTRISDLWKNDRARVDAMVADVNTTMDSVAALNERIRREKISGADVNELIDQRALLITQLSKYTGATAREREDGTVDVLLAGNTMVHGQDTNHIESAGASDMPGIDTAPATKFGAATQALIVKKGSGADTATFTYKGVTSAKYQPMVAVYQVGDKGPDGNTLTAASSLLGSSYIAYYDTEAMVTSGTKPQDAKVVGTDQKFNIGNFAKDEGPVRLTWHYGQHQVVISEGTLGATMNNLAPATRPYVSGTIGKGGSYAETGKLYNDLAKKIATEVNTLHTTAGAKSLIPKDAVFLLKDPSQPESDTNPNPNAPIGTTVERSAYPDDQSFQDAVAAQAATLRNDPQYAGKAVIVKETRQDAGDLFSFTSADNRLPAVLRMQVAIKDPEALAAGVEENGVFDGSVAYSISKAPDAEDSAVNQWSKSVVDIGVHTRGADDRASLAEQTRKIAERALQSATGVDMNEEAVKLIQGQHAYQGAARVMTTVNSMLDTLINLGR